MLVRLLAVFLTLFSVAHGFALSFWAKANPALKDLVKAQEGTHLNIRLDISRPSDESRMVLDGLGLSLKEALIPKQKNKSGNDVKMPGANGPNPQLSSGVRSLEVTKAPSFVSMDGLTNVPLENGCWEMIWREEAPAGAIICGFHVPNEVSRNGVSLPSGRVWLSFPIWTKNMLKEFQEKKRKAEAKAQEFLDKKQEELNKIMQTNNLLLKALHYRNAIKAMEDYDATAIGYYKQVPEDSDIVEIEDGLLLTTTGTIWTKERGMLGDEHVLLGSALVRPEEEASYSGLAP